MDLRGQTALKKIITPTIKYISYSETSFGGLVMVSNVWEYLDVLGQYSIP